MVHDPIRKKSDYAYCNPCALVTDYDNGEIICSDCGLVMIERFEDQGKEWRSFAGSDSERNRVGQATSPVFGNVRLFTVIGDDKWDFSGKQLPSTMKESIHRLRVLDSRSKSHTSFEKNFCKVFYEFEKLKDKLAISDATIEKAAYLFRKAMNRKLSRGRSVLLIAASCLYISCRENETPRTLYDIADATNVKKTEVSACFRLLVNELELTLPIVNLSHCVVRIANTIGASEKVKRYAIKVLQKAEQINITAGKDPMGLAAAAIYLVGTNMGEYHSQKIISEIAKTTSVTIRNRCEDLRQNLLITEVFCKDV